MRPHTPSEWAWTAYLSVMAVLSLLMILGQMARSPGPLQTIERDLSWAESPSVLYYGARDTSVLRWVCCRVVGR